MTRKKIAPVEREKTALLISLDDAKGKVNDQIGKGNNIFNAKIGNEEELRQSKANYKTWRDFTKELLRQIFSTSELADEFSGFLGAVSFGGRPPTLQEKINDFQQDLRRDLDRLVSIHERLQLFPIAVVRHPKGTTDPVIAIEQIARRFHIVARQLRQRHENRATLDISDEYDVQDLFHALLKVFFDDVRSEEWTPSYAGGASRMDFLLKAEQTVVEIKKTRAGLGARELGNQLLEDIGRYQAHPDCHRLICFAYDPDGRITNPDGLERDLSRAINEMAVSVIVAPKGQ